MTVDYCNKWHRSRSRADKVTTIVCKPAASEALLMICTCPAEAGLHTLAVCSRLPPELYHSPLNHPEPCASHLRTLSAPHSRPDPLTQLLSHLRCAMNTLTSLPSSGASSSLPHITPTGVGQGDHPQQEGCQPAVCQQGTNDQHRQRTHRAAG